MIDTSQKEFEKFFDLWYNACHSNVTDICEAFNAITVTNSNDIINLLNAISENRNAAANTVLVAEAICLAQSHMNYNPYSRLLSKLIYTNSKL